MLADSILKNGIKGLVALLAMVCLAGSAHAADSKQVVIGIWGGTWGEYLRGVIDKFAKPRNIQVTYVEGTSSGLLSKAVAQRNRPQMDIFLGNETTMAQARNLGVAAPLDPGIVKNLGDVAQRYRAPDQALIWAYYAIGFVYLTDEFKKANLEPPTSWSALLRKDLKGKIGLISPPNLYGEATLIGLATVNGGDENNMEPAMKLLPALRDNALTATASSGQVEDLTRTREVWLHPTSPARAWLMKQGGLPVEFAVPKDAAIVSLNAIMLVKNGPNPGAAQEILNYLISAPVQEDMAEFGVVMPVNVNAKVSPEKLKFMGLADRPAEQVKVIDGNVAAGKLDDWTRSWTQTFAR